MSFKIELDGIIELIFNNLLISNKLIDDIGYCIIYSCNEEYKIQVKIIINLLKIGKFELKDGLKNETYQLLLNILYTYLGNLLNKMNKDDTCNKMLDVAELNLEKNLINEQQYIDICNEAKTFHNLIDLFKRKNILDDDGDYSKTLEKYQIFIQKQIIDDDKTWFMTFEKN